MPAGRIPLSPDPVGCEGAPTVRPAGFDEVAPLFAELDVDLDRRYGGGEPVHVSREEFDPPVGALLVVEDGATLAGCVGIRFLSHAGEHAGDRTAELKRMYVRPTARRRGLARVLLSAAEDAASQLGYARLWLETGLRQPEAIDLYRSAGYEPVARFGQFADEAESVYLGRDLPLRRTSDRPRGD